MPLVDGVGSYNFTTMGHGLFHPQYLETGKILLFYIFRIHGRSHFVTAERYTGNNRYKFVALLLLKNDRSRSIPSNDFRTPKNLRFPAEHPLDAQLKGSPLRVWINPATFKPASRESLAVVALAVVRCFGVEPLNNHLFIIDI